MSAADGWLAWNAADNIVKNYQNNNQINGQPRLYVRDQHANQVAVKGWWLKMEHLQNLINATNAAIAPRTLSGVRVYPALMNRDEQGNPIPDYHTLVFVGTKDDNGVHNNVQLDKVVEFVVPCPIQCPVIGVLGH